MKKSIKRIATLISVLTLAVSALAGCGSAEAKGSTTSTDNASQVRTIRLGNFPTAVWNAQIIVAQQNGYFDKAFEGKNVNIEITTFANGPAANEAFVAGDLDIINGIGDQPVVIGISNEVPVKILAGAAKQGENIGVIAPGDAGISSPEDLKGKRIGVYIGTYVHKSVIGILNDAGISEDEVELVNISSVSDATAAFDSGDIDAYLSMSGAYIKEKLSEGYVEVVDCSKHPAFSYIVAAGDFVDNNPDLVDAFFEAIVSAEEWINNNQEESYKTISEFSGIEADTVKATIEGAVVQLKWDEDYEQNLFDTYDFLYSHEMLSTELSKDQILSRVDTAVVDKAYK